MNRSTTIFSSFTRALTRQTTLSSFSTASSASVPTAQHASPSKAINRLYSTTPFTDMSTADADYRLPSNVVPIHYDLTIKTDLETKSFEGSGSILLKVLSQTLNSLTFNVHPSLSIHSLSLHSTALKTDSVYQIEDSAISRDDKKERATVKLDDALGLKKGDEVSLRLGWKADLGNSMLGYYISSYTNKDKKQAIYTLTQFEATSARRAFPCWDEPALKATFSLTMVSAADTVSLSNMDAVDEKPLSELKDEDSPKTSIKLIKTIKTELKTESSSSEEEAKKWKVTTFGKSPKMSTYLLTFANGRFEYREDSYKSPLTGRDVPLRIYATDEIINQVDYALDVTKRAVPIYEQIFDIPFPLPKLDSLVAHDFDAGAMEGWGLITGRTSVLLLDKKSGLAAQKRVATVQSHEIAHQWFGDLCTMEWWKELWLNEAFATLMGEVIIPDRLYPEWDVRTSFITQHLFRALELDSQRSSHPIEVEIPNAQLVDEVFDAISYSKGASVLRMIAKMVGEEDFLKGVSLYLKENAYSNARTEDLWKGISTASGVDVTSIAKSWVEKIGFPVVSAQVKDGKLSLRQDRFLSTGDVAEEENQTLWHIPLGLLTVEDDGKASVDASTILSERESTVDLKGAKLFKLNAGTTGVYRVAYDASYLDILGKEAGKAEGSALAREDRVGLVSDAHQLSRAGYSSTTGSLSLLSHLKDEPTEVVWTAIATSLSDIASVWWEESQEVQDAINALRRSLFGPLMDRMTFDFKDSDSPETRELRSLAYSVAGAAGYEPVIEHAKESFAASQKGDDSAIHPDLEGSIFRLAVQHGDESTYNSVKEIYRNPTNPSQKIAALSALSRTTDSALVQKTLDMIKTEVKDQDVAYVIANLSANTKAGRRAVLEYFLQEYDTLMNRFEGFSISRIVKLSTSNLSSPDDLARLKEFFSSRDTSRFTRTYAQTIEGIDAASRWVAKDRKAVEGWLREKKFLA